MDQFKIDIFRRERPGEVFPKIEALGPSVAERFRSGLAALVQDPQAATDGLKLLHRIAERSQPVSGTNAEEFSFDIRQLFKELGLGTPDRVYVDWYRFDRIDGIAFADLATYFEYIWYPSSDDIQIFDESLSWVVLIRHDGHVSAVLPTR